MAFEDSFKIVKNHLLIAVNYLLMNVQYPVGLLLVLFKHYTEQWTWKC